MDENAEVKVPKSPAKDSGNDSEPIKELSTKEAYFASLREWAVTQNAMAMFPFYLMANYPQLFQPQLNGQPIAPSTATNLPQHIAAATSPPAPQPSPQEIASFNRFRVLNEVQQADIINRYGGFEHVVAPFWKRAVAEAIDVFILFLIKIIVSFAIVNFFDLDVGFDINKDVMRKTFVEEDLFISFFEGLDFISLSSDLFLIELITKIIVCFYETLWTVWNNGATPGKVIMHIRIRYVEAVLPLQAPVVPQFVFQPQREPMRALLYPAQNPKLMRAFMRALAKNLVMTLLFPICVVMVFFKNNRTAYDIITKTIVVEDSNVNVLFRPQQPQRQ